MAFHVSDACIGCGLCTSQAPETFQLSDAGVAEVIRQPEDPAQARAAMEQCPVSAITEE